MKVLITGGAGFIGFHLAKRLAEKNNVTVIDNFARGKKDAEFIELVSKKNVEFIKGDITEKSTFEQLEIDYDHIYHLAAINGTENFYNIPDKVLKVGVLGTINMLDWFKNLKKGKLLFSSSSETYSGALNLLGDKFPIPTPENVPLVIENPANVRWSYGGSKILGEIAMHAYAKTRMNDFVIVRYHNVYGPRMGFEHVVPQFIERIRKKESPFNIYGGGVTRSFCYVDDAVQATELIMQKNTNGQTINIGRGDEEIQITQLAKKLLKIADHEIPLKINQAPKGSVKRRCPDTTKLRNMGFLPKTSLEEGLKKTYNWYLETLQ